MEKEKKVNKSKAAAAERYKKKVARLALKAGKPQSATNVHPKPKKKYKKTTKPVEKSNSEQDVSETDQSKDSKEEGSNA